jgi:hypothetical protein
MWTAEEDGRLVDGFGSGEAIEDLAAALGRQPSAVTSRLMKVGLVPASGEAADPSGHVRAVDHAREGGWTAEDDGRLVAGFRAGAVVADLAAELGRSPSEVEARLVKVALWILREFADQ